MYGPCVARGFLDLADAVLHQCIRPLIGARVLRAIMDISARAVSLPVRPRPGRSGHQCSHAPGRPILHRRLDLSQTSAGKLRLSYVIDSSSFDVVPLFVPGGRSFVPAWACRRARARREDHAGWDAVASVVLTHAKARPLLRTAQAMRASLLASAMASTLWCSRFFAASIHDLSP
jgi:hypothetical protein